MNPDDRPAPVSLSFDDEPLPSVPPAAAITEPEPRATAGWLSDSFTVAALSLCSLLSCAVAAVKLGQVRYPLDFLRDTSTLWLVLFALLILAWSAFFTLRRAVVD